MIKFIGNLRQGLFVLDGREVAYVEEWKVYANGECLGEVETVSEARELVLRRIGN